MIMATEFIICPNCHVEIPLTEAITHQIKDGLKTEFDGKIKALEMDFQEQLLREKEKIETEAIIKAESNVQTDIEDLKAQVSEKDKKLKDARERELAFLQKSREIDERAENIDLEIATKINEQRDKIKEESIQKFQQQFQLKLAEKDQQIQGLSSTVNELQRKLEQGSQQLQGEVLELELEDLLRELFPSDIIEPVAKGIRGADILHQVYHNRKFCGTILWESKRAKNWKNDWLSKLKQDQRDANADIAVLYTTVFPKEMTNFGYFEGIWITDQTSIAGLTTALRIMLIEVIRAKITSEGKNEKMEMMHNYLCGPEFKLKLQGIGEAICSMQEDLHTEKKAMQKIWAKREKNIQNMMENASRIVGDMHGILGRSFPEIQGFELTDGSDD
jgi:hypothetical protein